MGSDHRTGAGRDGAGGPGGEAGTSVGSDAMNAIVVGTDGSAGSEAAVRRVIDLAGGSGAKIHLVCAYPGRSTLERLGLTGKSDAIDMRGVAMDVLARDERRFEEAGFT